MSKKVAVTLVAILAALAFFTGLAFAAAKTITGEVVSVEPSEKGWPRFAYPVSSGVWRLDCTSVWR